MANVYATDYGKKPVSVQGNSAFAENYSVAKAANNGDKVYLGIIPGGVEVDDSALVHDACGASVTLKLGFEPVDPDDTLSADDDYFLAAGQDVSSAGRKQSNAHPIRFNRPVALVATIGGANFSGTPKLTAVVKGKSIGVA